MRDAKPFSPSVCALATLFVTHAAFAAGPALGDYASHAQSGRAWVVTTTDGQALRITPYGDDVVRVQGAAVGQPFTPDDHYAMVVSHDTPGALTASDADGSLTFDGPTFQIVVGKSPLRVDVRAGGASLVSEQITGGLVTGDRPLTLSVNGAAQPSLLAFPVTGNWSAWSTTTAQVTLPTGASTIRVAANGAGGANVDSLTVDGVIYEAETAAHGGAVVANQYAGYTGAGYIDFQNASGDYLEWTVNAAAAGTHTLAVRYANGAAAAQTWTPPGADEHFFGLGYGGFGRVASLDLRGTTVARNREYQAPILTPFFVSSHGYGVFANSTWQNSFSFTDESYGFTLAGGQIDYFVIAGPAILDVLDRYTALTGRPRMPPLAAFGLGLSDKLDDSLPSNEAWWKTNIERMRAGNWPFDLAIHDNSWRNGKTAAWQWDTTRYPDPAEFESWCTTNGVSNQLDFNRADDTLSAGWQASYLMPGTVDFPDFSSPTVRAWFWNLLATKSFDPALGYPGDFLWLDEPDDPVTPTGPLADGRTWDEDGNAYFFYELQAVGEGWDATFAGKKRPYVMMRGATAGAQRWGTVWSGDINDTYDEMKLEIRGMLAAGLSGFPFWAHDAGGFQTLPSDAMYRQWSIAMGSFAPMWKPHGIGLRFPWQFSADAQNDMRTYGALRMQLLPYLYSAAWRAATTGTPIARAMMIDSPSSPAAWAADQEYMWGDALLVAPSTSDGGTPVTVWFPPGEWYGFWDDAMVAGGASVEVPAPTGTLPLFVKAGAILFGALPTSSTKTWNRTVRVLDVYAGADGSATQFEDDGVSDAYQHGQRALTVMAWNDLASRLTITKDDGAYDGSPATRTYRVNVHGVAAARDMQLNGAPIASTWDAQKQVLMLETPPLPVDADVVIEPRDGNASDGGPSANDAGDAGGGDAGVLAPPAASCADATCDGGCSCRVARAEHGGAAFSFFAALAAVTARRRGRRTAR